ncbi:hypothetical protein M413DRAFT_446015, partial [Hebeloma cylindrosporum]
MGVAARIGESPREFTPETFDVEFERKRDASYDALKSTCQSKSLILDMPSQEAWKKIVSAIGEGQAAPILQRFVLTVKED